MNELKRPVKEQEEDLIKYIEQLDRNINNEIERCMEYYIEHDCIFKTITLVKVCSNEYIQTNMLDLINLILSEQFMSLINYYDEGFKQITEKEYYFIKQSINCLYNAIKQELIEGVN